MPRQGRRSRRQARRRSFDEDHVHHPEFAPACQSAGRRRKLTFVQDIRNSGPARQRSGPAEMATGGATMKTTNEELLSSTPISRRRAVQGLAALGLAAPALIETAAGKVGAHQDRLRQPRPAPSPLSARRTRSFSTASGRPLVRGSPSPARRQSKFWCAIRSPTPAAPPKSRLS